MTHGRSLGRGAPPEPTKVLASLPPLAIVALMGFNVITPSTGLAVGLAAALLALDALGWRAVAAMFDRERFVTGRRG
jgi:ABC-2 type transport system permease protein